VVSVVKKGETSQDVDRLFDLPLDEFTAAKNELAKRLKNEGDAEGAEQVRALAKPSVAAWAVNQLARHEAELVRSLLNVAARLRNAQERSLQGERAADELRAAQSEERTVINKLTKASERQLRESGRAASATTLERVSSILRAAAVSDPSALRAGRLSGDVEVTGFDAFAGMELPKGRGSRGAAGSDDLAERRQQKRDAERRRKQLQKRVRELSASADAAERDAERARKEAEEATSVAEERRREADAAAAELESLD
jgi:hypothetical protein